MLSEKQSPARIPLIAKSPFELRADLSRDVPSAEMRSALATGNMGFLHSFTTGSTVDGPGVRVVAWTAGCQMRCLYCHNPDTWNMRNGILITLPKAVSELSKYRHGLKIMSGGFTLSGGEPLMQDRFAMKLLAAAKEMGIHTALDTNGQLGSRVSDAELESIDLVLLDIKSWDADRHLRLTGMEIAPVLAFGRRLAERNKRIWLRFVLVPGLTDDSEDVAQIARYAASLKVVERVDVLPFHQMGRYKWNVLGIRYELGNTEPPSRDQIERACAQFRSAGLKTY